MAQANDREKLIRALRLIRKGLSTDSDAEALTFLRKGAELLDDMGMLTDESAAPQRVKARPQPRGPTVHVYTSGTTSTTNTATGGYFHDIFGNRT